MAWVLEGNAIAENNLDYSLKETAANQLRVAIALHYFNGRNPTRFTVCCP